MTQCLNDKIKDGTFRVFLNQRHNHFNYKPESGLRNA